MEWYHFLIIAIIVIVVMKGIVKRSKRKPKPYRTDYKPTEPNHLTRQETTLGHLINTHRDKLSLLPMEFCALSCRIAKEHCNYMKESGVANHDNYPERREKLVENNALEMGEVVSSGFQNAKGFMHGYLNSKKHRQILEGNYTHFGIATIENKKNYNVVIAVKY